MTNITKILVLEDDIRDCEELKKYADSKENIHILTCTADSDHAIEIAKTEQPDAIIIDLELHNGSGNGLLFLSSIRQLNLQNTPYLLVTTNNSSHTTHEAARSLGADFILTKYESAHSAKYVIDFLEMMVGTLTKQQTPATTQATPISSNPIPASAPNESIPDSDIMDFIRQDLMMIGISPKAVGFRYLVDAVWIKLHNRDANIYSILGPKYNKSDPSIERSMQYAINRAWRVSDPDDLIKYYCARIHSDRGVPTILEFVFYYVSRAERFLKDK